MKIKKLICALLFLLSICCIPVNANANDKSSYEPISTETNLSSSLKDDTPTSYAYDIRWLYKIENGVLYRRQYNYTLNKWIGDWERVN